MHYSFAIIGRVMGFIICPYALIRGGPSERWGAAFYTVSWGLCAVLQDHHLKGPGLWVFLIDVCGLVAFAALSIWSRKIWALFAGAFQLNTVLSHVVWWLFPQVGLVSYVTALGLWGGYGLLCTILMGMVGVEMERWRKRPAKAKIAARQV